MSSQGCVQDGPLATIAGQTRSAMASKAKNNKMVVRTIEDTKENKVGNKRTKIKQRNPKILHNNRGNIRIQYESRKQTKKQIQDERKPKIQKCKKKNPEMPNSNKILSNMQNSNKSDLRIQNTNANDLKEQDEKQIQPNMRISKKEVSNIPTAKKNNLKKKIKSKLQISKEIQPKLQNSKTQTSKKIQQKIPNSQKALTKKKNHDLDMKIQHLKHLGKHHLRGRFSHSSLSRKRGPSRGIFGSKKRHHDENFLLVEINQKFGLKVTTFSELFPKPQPIKTIKITTHAKAVQYNPKTRKLFYFSGTRLITSGLISDQQRRVLTVGTREEVYILRIDFNRQVTFMTTSYNLIIQKIFKEQQKHLIKRIYEMEISPDERLASICTLHNSPLTARYGTVNYHGTFNSIHTVKGAPCGPTFILEGHVHIVGDVLVRYDIHTFKQALSPCLKLEETSKYFILNHLIYSIDSKKGKIEKRECTATTTIYDNLESTNSHSNWYMSNYIK